MCIRKPRAEPSSGSQRYSFWHSHCGRCSPLRITYMYKLLVLIFSIWDLGLEHSWPLSESSTLFQIDQICPIKHTRKGVNQNDIWRKVSVTLFLFLRKFVLLCDLSITKNNWAEHWLQDIVMMFPMCSG